MGKELSRNNKGFSLVELIVTVLIMGIISATAVVSIARISGAKVDSAVKITGSALKQARAKAMALTNEAKSDGTSDVFVYFEMRTGNYYADTYLVTRVPNTETDDPDDTKEVCELITSEKICNNSLELKFSNHDSSVESFVLGTDDGVTTGVKIYFKKSTGGIAGIYKVSGATDNTVEADDKINCDTITLTGPADLKKLILVEVTGRCFIDSDSGLAPTEEPDPSGAPASTEAPTAAPEGI